MHTINTAVRLNPFFLSFKRPSAHSKYSPSSGDRWLKSGCSFSVGFIERVQPEEEESEYAAEGTLGHSYCEAIFRNVFYGMTVPLDLTMKLALLEDHGAEMHQAAVDYVEIITFWLNNYEVIGDVIFMGQEVPTPIFPEKGCFGTSDFLIVGTKGAVVIDFKYGKGKNVKADTVQLKIYAAGVARFLEGVTADYKIHVVIHQPRITSAAKEHYYTMHELYGFLNEIWESIEIAERPNLQPCEGNHCFWCPARRTKVVEKKCPAIVQKPITLANEAFDKFFSDMAQPTDNLMAVSNPTRDAAILKLHALYPLIKDTVESTKKELDWRLRNGEVIPGFSLVTNTGNRELIGGDTAEEKAKYIQSKFPTIQPWKEVPATYKLKTLSELEKEIGKTNLDIICQRKVTKTVEVNSEKTEAVLGSLSLFAQMINNKGE